MTIHDATREVEVPVRELRNRTRDVVALVEQGWTVYLTSHGRRFASLNPVTDPTAAPRLTALLADLDTSPAEQSGLADVVAAQRAADRQSVAVDPWR